MHGRKSLAELVDGNDWRSGLHNGEVGRVARSCTELTGRRGTAGSNPLSSTGGRQTRQRRPCHLAVMTPTRLP